MERGFNRRSSYKALEASEAIQITSQLNESNYKAQQSFLKGHWWKPKLVLNPKLQRWITTS